MNLFLDTFFIGQNFIFLSEIPSTNHYAWKLLESRASEGTVVYAQIQSAGRGQAGNTWNSEPGQNLPFSLILYPNFLPVHSVFYLSKMVAVALHKCVSHFLPDVPVHIKWPNDLLVFDKKVAGILIENQLEKDRVQASVIGIGLNVNQSAFPPEIAHKAASLASFSDKSLVLEKVFEYLLSCLESEYLSLRNGNFDALDRYYLTHLWGYQEDVWLEIAGEIKQVYIAGVEKSGRLAVSDQGNMRYFDIKEVAWVQLNN